MRLQKLFEPTKIRNMTLKNRIIMPAMDTNLGSPDGSVSPKMLGYYEERAKGGASLIIVQTTSVDYPRGKTTPFQISIDHDRYLPGLSQLAQAIKGSGARAAIQLEDGGGVTHSSITGQQPVGPSASMSPLGEPIRELSTTEIAGLIERHAQAAARAQKAGFDAVEIHGGHEHLLSQFLSPYYNHRSDQYGGGLENRARFLLEVLRACRSHLGSDYPLLCRINGAEYGIDPSIDLVQTVQIAQWVEEAGVDAIDVTGHGYGVRFTALCPGMPGLHLAGAAEIKRSVKTPVIAVGRIYPELGEWALREGVADIIAMGRALIADPYLPNKVAEGRLEDIVPCIGCWQCLEGSIQSIIQAVAEPGSPTEGKLTCSVNPAAGREREYVISPAPISKRVVVVGGGPAGMEAARVARLRGHDVTLIERDSHLGGQLRAAAAAPRKESLSLLIDYFQSQLAKLGVRVELGREATLAELVTAQPEEVVWAAGAAPSVPDIPGIDRAKVVFATDVLTGKSFAGDTVVIIGAETVGCETANFLADKGVKVTLVCRKPQALTKVGPIVQMELLEDLAGKGVQIITSAKYEGFNRDGLTIRTEAGELRNLGADTYVLAAGAQPISKLIPALRKKFRHVHAIGDCLEPRRISDAITDGFEIGRSL